MAEERARIARDLHDAAGHAINVILVHAGATDVKQLGAVMKVLSPRVKGVADGYEKVLELKGTGYRVELKGTTLHFALGLSHPGNYNVAKGVTLTYEANAEYYQDSFEYTIMSYFGSSNTGAIRDSFAATPLAQSPFLTPATADFVPSPFTDFPSTNTVGEVNKTFVINVQNVSPATVANPNDDKVTVSLGDSRFPVSAGSGGQFALADAQAHRHAGWLCLAGRCLDLGDGSADGVRVGGVVGEALAHPVLEASEHLLHGVAEQGELERRTLVKISEIPKVVKDAFVLEGSGKVKELVPGVAIIADSTWAAFSARRQLKELDRDHGANNRADDLPADHLLVAHGSVGADQHRRGMPAGGQDDGRQGIILLGRDEEVDGAVEAEEAEHHAQDGPVLEQRPPRKLCGAFVIAGCAARAAP